MLGSKNDDSATKRLDELTRLVREMAEDRKTGIAAKERQVANLEREKVAKEIELDRVKEDHDREKREIEHMVGLHKKRVEQEIELAKREQVVTLREENLAADRKRFEDQMDYIRTRMEEEQTATRALVSEMLARLPVVTVDRRETLSLVEGQKRESQ